MFSYHIDVENWLFYNLLELFARSSKLPQIFIPIFLKAYDNIHAKFVLRFLSLEESLQKLAAILSIEVLQVS